MTTSLDYYDIESQLSADERMVRDTARKFVEEEYLPIVRAAFRDGYFPKQVIPRIAALGFLGANLPERVRLRRSQQRRLRAHQPGARARRLGAALVRERAVVARHVSDLRVRIGGAEEPLACEARLGRARSAASV